jgi:hypothetical protein
MIDALASSGLPWLTDEERMDIEPGINDFEASELEWLKSRSRNAKSVLATRITERFTAGKVWEKEGYARQLQIMIRILTVVQEFRRLNDVLMFALANNSQQDSLVTLVTAVATWHAPLEGMGVLPTVINTLVASVQSPHFLLTSVAENIHQLEAIHLNNLTPDTPTHPSRLLLPRPSPAPRRLRPIPTIDPARLPRRCVCLAPLGPRPRSTSNPRPLLRRRILPPSHCDRRFRRSSLPACAHCHRQGMHL